MSEFIILGGTSAGIYGINATQSYVYTRNDGAAFSSAATAQFGNGFASFKIDGSCDTIWAGYRFQKKVSSDTSDGNRNQINIENTGSVSGGQGLLVWSRNYDVNNSGVISGGTYAIQTGAGNDTITVNGGEITGSIDLGTGTDTLNVTGAGSAKFDFTLNKDTSTSAQVVNAETVTIADNTKLAVTMMVTKNVRHNDQFLIVDTNTLTVTPGNLAIQNDSSLPMISFSATKDGNKLYLLASRNRR